MIENYFICSVSLHCLHQLSQDVQSHLRKALHNALKFHIFGWGTFHRVSDQQLFHNLFLKKSGPRREKSLFKKIGEYRGQKPQLKIDMTLAYYLKQESLK